MTAYIFWRNPGLYTPLFASGILGGVDPKYKISSPEVNQLVPWIRVAFFWGFRYDPSKRPLVCSSWRWYNAFFSRRNFHQQKFTCGGEELGTWSFEPGRTSGFVGGRRQENSLPEWWREYVTLRIQDDSAWCICHDVYCYGRILRIS